MNEQTATEMREKLLAAKEELITVMRQVIDPINKITCRLIEQADLLIKESMAEKTFSVRKRKVVYVPSGQESEPRTMQPAGYPSVISTEKREALKKERENQLIPGKRACSICRKPGHRAKNCPESGK